MTQAEAASTAKSAPKVKPNHNYLRDKHKELVRGKFNFHEVPGGTLNFSFKEFKGDKIVRYDLVDGEIYSLPLGVAKHLNKNGWYPTYNFVTGDSSIQTGAAVAGFSNNNIQKITRKVHRYGFQSLEFIDIDDLPTSSSSIVTVESV